MNQKNPDTQNKQAAFMNKVIGYGVAGFRIDAAKHMYPEDLEILWSKLNDLPTQWFPGGSKPFMYLEVIDLNQYNEVAAAWYQHLGRVTEFRFCPKIYEVSGLSRDVIYNIGDHKDIYTGRQMILGGGGL